MISVFLFFTVFLNFDLVDAKRRRVIRRIYHPPFLAVDKSKEYAFRVLQAIEFLIPKDVVGKEKVRIGNLGDGGYFMLDDFSKTSKVYSISMEDEYSWELDMATRNFVVSLFKPGVSLGENVNPKIRIHSLGDSSYTLDSILRVDGNLNGREIIIKMNVKEMVWNVLSDTGLLDRFDQIVLSLDFLQFSIDKFSVILRAFENLNKTHQLIWVHGNNIGGYGIYGGIPFPNFLEVTYVKRNNETKFARHDSKKNRIDERNFRGRGEFLLWWVEIGEEFDFEGFKKMYTPNAKEVFSNIYSTRYWTGPTNVLSGPGSLKKFSIPYFNLLQKYLDENKPKTVVDLGCGDWETTKDIVFSDGTSYTGVDLVESVIRRNQEKYSKANIKFECINTTDDIMNYTADLLIVKDVIQHWSNSEAVAFFEKILPHFKHAIFTHDFLWKKPHLNNQDILTGSCRGLDLEKDPFNLKVEKLLDYESLKGNIKRVYIYHSNTSVFSQTTGEDSKDL